MGCWTSETEELPGPKFQQTPEAKSASAFLTALLTGKSPKLDIAGMTDVEKASYDVLQSVLNAPTPDIYYKGLAEIEKTLGGDYDPRTSPYYEGIKMEAATMKESGVAGLRRGSQAGGMFYGEPSMRAEGAYTSGIDANVLQTLGQLYEAERGRMTNATGMALNYAQLPQQMGLQKVAAGMQFGSLPRDIQQQIYNAQYQSEMFPYTYQAPIAQNIAGQGSQWYTPQYYSTPSTFSQIIQGAGDIASVAGSFFNPSFPGMQPKTSPYYDYGGSATYPVKPKTQPTDIFKNWGGY